MAASARIRDHPRSDGGGVDLVCVVRRVPLRIALLGPFGRSQMAIATTPFTGFDSDAIQFLVDLADNNSRDWFQPRKTEYERLLKEPMEQLCIALDSEFRSRDIPLHADPAKSPFRIYRD